jgi:hypothetical protein
MQYLIHWPDERFLIEAGFGSAARAPCIFDDGWVYQKIFSWYMRDRLKGEPLTDYGHRKYPTKQSLETFARALCNFLEWSAWSRCPWDKISYTHDLINGYQKHMQTGIWSVARKPLSARTVNQRVDEACNFLRWAAQRGLRGPFEIHGRKLKLPRVGIANRASEKTEIMSRMGRIRTDPMKLNMPSHSDVLKWLNCVLIQKGATKALMCELIIESAIRREECAQWRIWTLPQNRDNWEIFGDHVMVEIEYGAKGAKHLDKNGQEVGPKRHIVLPLKLAQKIHEYREYVRPKIRLKYVNAASSEAERKRRLKHIEPRLFLSEYDGKPISGKQLRRAWSDVSVKPYSEWSPHLGRHYWACRTLLIAYQARQKQLSNHTAITGDWITGHAQSDILMIVQPQLGHIDSKTVNCYLRWLHKAALGLKYDDQWIFMLEEDAPPRGFEP